MRGQRRAGDAALRLRRLRACLTEGLIGCFTWIVAAALAGCSNGAGSLLIDPGRYSTYHCNDLATRWKELVKREKELRDLMDRADEGGGGAVIGSLAYRPEYEFRAQRRNTAATHRDREEL